MYKSFADNSASCRRINENHVKDNRRELVDSLVNCDNKRNHCNRYVPDALLSGQTRSKLSIDDESSQPINGSSTNNKTERKRNINMLRDGEKIRVDGTGSDDDVRDTTKRIKVDGVVDGRGNNKTKMFQVSSEGKLTRFSNFHSSLAW